MSVGFQIVVLSAVAYYTLIPLGECATGESSSVIVHAAERWEELRLDKRKKFARQMLIKHDLMVTQDNGIMEQNSSLLPYI